MSSAVGNSLNAASQGIAAQYSQLSQVVLGHNSVYMPKGGQALTPTARDDTTYIAPANGVQTPVWAANNQIIYSLPKTATLIGKCWHEVTLSAGQTNPNYTPPSLANPVAGTAAVAAVGTPQAEYIKNVGDLICSYIILRYGSTPLQQYTTQMVVAQRMLEKNNINIEDINVEVLGNLSPGGNSEQTLIDAFYRGVTLRHPLDESWFTQSQDRHWMPESLALEGTLNFTLRDLQYCIVTSTGTNAVLTGTPGGGGVAAALPTITNCVLRYQQITLSAAEKMNRLAIYKSPEGMVNLFEDTEDQLMFQYVVPGAVTASQAITLNVPLSNFRMDSKEIIFYVRCAVNTGAYAAPYNVYSGNLQGYQGSMLESDRLTPSILVNGGNTGVGNVIGTLLPITQYKLVSNGKDLYNYQPELLNRTYQRKQYHPDAEVGAYVYCHEFAIYPEDTRNATGHISTSTLGNLTLVIQLNTPALPATSAAGSLTLQVDCHSKSYNLMQSRGGSIAKALN
jgi:hypothetical protein